MNELLLAAPEPAAVEYESDHDYEALPSTPDAGDADFSDLTRSAFETTQREAAASETRAASEKERVKEDAKIEKEMAQKTPNSKSAQQNSKRNPPQRRSQNAQPPPWMMIVYSESTVAKFSAVISAN